MLVESIAILLILLIMVGVFLRAGRKDYTLCILPLTFVPLVHTAVILLAEGFAFVSFPNVRAFSDVFALAISVAVTGMLSASMKSKRVKAAYLLMCGGFSTVLTLIYLYHIYKSV